MLVIMIKCCPLSYSSLGKTWVRTSSTPLSPRYMLTAKTNRFPAIWDAMFSTC